MTIKNDLGVQDTDARTETHEFEIVDNNERCFEIKHGQRDENGKPEGLTTVCQLIRNLPVE